MTLGEHPLQWLRDMLQAMFGDLMAEPVKVALKKWMEKTGEKVGEHTADYVSLKLFGLRSEDERRFNLALTRLDPNETTILMRRLGRLQSHQSDYYRITVMRDNPDETVTILRSHAQMTNADWRNLVVVMNYNQTLDQSRFVRFGRWVATQVATANTALNNATAGLDAVNTDLQQRLDARVGQPLTTRAGWKQLGLRIASSFVTGLH